MTTGAVLLGWAPLNPLSLCVCTLIVAATSLEPIPGSGRDRILTWQRGPLAFLRTGRMRPHAWVWRLGTNGGDQSFVLVSLLFNGPGSRKRGRTDTAPPRRGGRRLFLSIAQFGEHQPI